MTDPTAFKPERRPPLELDVEIETPDDVFRRPCDHRVASKRPKGINFSTQRGDGMGPGGCSFARSIFKDYPDIGELDTWRFVGRNGDIAHESRLRSNPRGNDPQQQLDVQLVGWMTYLAGKPCAPLIIDGRPGSWGEPSLQRKADLAAAKVRLDAAVSPGWQGGEGAAPGVGMNFAGVISGNGYSDRGEAWFYGGGEKLGALLYHFNKLSGGGSAFWETVGVLSADDRIKGGFDPGIDHDATTDASSYREVTASGDRYYAAFSSSYADPGTTTMTDLHAWEWPKVLGDHGLTLRGDWPEVGFYVSDIIRYVIERYFPKVTWAGQTNTYIVQQAAWHDSTAPGYDIIRQLDDLVLWETNMWENRSFHFEPADLTKYDWIIRTTDPGVKVAFEGPSIEDFANGAVVSYTGFDGLRHTLYPSDHPELRDEDDANPANRHSEDLWTPFEVPWPCTEAEALQFGRARLAEFNRPKRPGRYRISSGYIRDAARHWQQGWKVRNSQTLGILDHPDDSPRLITATNWNAGELEITVDAPSKTMDAMVARQQRRREGVGLT